MRETPRYLTEVAFKEPFVFSTTPVTPTYLFKQRYDMGLINPLFFYLFCTFFLIIITQSNQSHVIQFHTTISEFDYHFIDLQDDTRVVYWEICNEQLSKDVSIVIDIEKAGKWEKIAEFLDVKDSNSKYDFSMEGSFNGARIGIKTGEFPAKVDGLVVESSNLHFDAFYNTSFMMNRKGGGNDNDDDNGMMTVKMLKDVQYYRSVVVVEGEKIDGFVKLEKNGYTEKKLELKNQMELEYADSFSTYKEDILSLTVKLGDSTTSSTAAVAASAKITIFFYCIFNFKQPEGGGLAVLDFYLPSKECFFFDIPSATKYFYYSFNTKMNVTIRNKHSMEILARTNSNHFSGKIQVPDVQRERTVYLCSINNNKAETENLIGAIVQGNQNQISFEYDVNEIVEAKEKANFFIFQGINSLNLRIKSNYFFQIKLLLENNLTLIDDTLQPHSLMSKEWKSNDFQLHYWKIVFSNLNGTRNILKGKIICTLIFDYESSWWNDHYITFLIVGAILISQVVLVGIIINVSIIYSCIKKAKSRQFNSGESELLILNTSKKKDSDFLFPEENNYVYKSFLTQKE